MGLGLGLEWELGLEVGIASKMGKMGKAGGVPAGRGGGGPAGGGAAETEPAPTG
ncbi:hypothetical protein ACFY12_27355 [Streptomyces sp. NPDC001339]|uniref:hypothetical protein n=1 Tax=Streptomyces sp. NPDC001339 TaxID=3364563 RepID=UPI003692F365